MPKTRLWKAALAAAFLLPALSTSPARAQGVLLTPLPANPCPGAAPLKNVWVINELASDTVPLAGPGFGESLVVCYSTLKTGSPAIDVGVEWFDQLGLASGFFPFCGLPPGASAPFVTFPFFPPYIGIPAMPFGAPGMYSARILATKTNVACDATVFDTGAIAAGFSPGPAWSKDVTITKAKSTQKGD